MKKELLYFIMLSSFLAAYSQKGTVSADTAYLSVDEADIANFKDIYIPEFAFPNTTANYSISLNLLQPDANRNFENKKPNGAIKKISTFVKYAYNKEKKLRSYTMYNKEGLVTEISEPDDRGQAKEYFFYDAKSRPVSHIRLLNGDTLYKDTYEYNSRNQLTKFGNTTVEYDAQHRMVALKNSAANTVQYKIYYNNNLVKTEGWLNGKLVEAKEYIYSENYNPIKSAFGSYVVFDSYNDKKQLIKSVSFLNNKLNGIRYFEYNNNGDKVRSIFKSAADKAQGTKEENNSRFEYDQHNNKTYELSTGGISKNKIEYFYENEYY